MSRPDIVSIIAFDAALMNTGAAAVVFDYHGKREGTVYQVATFTQDTKRLKGIEKYEWSARQLARKVREALDFHARDSHILIETPTTKKSGKTWTTYTGALCFYSAGIIHGVAAALEFETINLISANAWGAGQRGVNFAKSLKLGPGIELFDEDGKPISEHVVDAAGMAFWYGSGL